MRRYLGVLPHGLEHTLVAALAKPPGHVRRRGRLVMFFICGGLGTAREPGFDGSATSRMCELNRGAHQSFERLLLGDSVRQVRRYVPLHEPHMGLDCAGEHAVGSGAYCPEEALERRLPCALVAGQGIAIKDKNQVGDFFGLGLLDSIFARG